MIEKNIFKSFLILIVRFVSAVDFFYRRLVFWVFSGFYKYERQGRCRRCGQCCKEIIITMEPKYLRVRSLRNFAIWWCYFFNRMRLIGCFIEDGYLLFTCEHITADNKCGCYSWRPFLCREYPKAFGYFEEPVTLPGCGYKFMRKNR